MHINSNCYTIKKHNKKPATISEMHKAKFEFNAEQHGPLTVTKLDQVFERSKHPLSTGRKRRVLIVNDIDNWSVNIYRAFKFK